MENRKLNEIDEIFQGLANYNIRYSMSQRFNDENIIVCCTKKNQRVMTIVFRNPVSYCESDDTFEVYVADEFGRNQKAIACQTAKEVFDILIPALERRGIE